jgi:assimilatory nitrate reductase catalytic subunit
MGFQEAFGYSSQSEVFAEHAALSGFENDGRRDFDISAHAVIEQAAYDALAPFQWPQPKGAASQVKRFFAKGGFYHPDGRARFIAVRAPQRRRVDEAFPYTLNTGRVRDHWHTMTRTGKSARLSSHLAEPFVEIHPRDAQMVGVSDADLVAIESPHGAAIVRALVTDRQAEGNLFVPMHWNDQFASKARIDALVAPVTDPVSGQPASKNVAVRARRFAARTYGFAVSAEKPQGLNAGYWAIAMADGGWRMELAFTEMDGDWIEWCRQAFSIPADIDPIGYTDRTSGEFRLAFFGGDRLLAALFLSPRPVAVARSWAVSQLRASHANLSKRFAVAAGRPGADKPDPGATVCSCFSVGVNQITAAIREGCHSVEAVGEKLSAGTNCGSCRAEIRGIIHACLAAAAE